MKRHYSLHSSLPKWRVVRGIHHSTDGHHCTDRGDAVTFTAGTPQPGRYSYRYLSQNNKNREWHWRDISMQPTPFLSPGLTSEAQASAPSCHPHWQWASQAGEFWAAALTISASLSPLCCQQIGSCIFIQGPEAPHLSFLIFPRVKGLFRVWKCFFFHSFFPGLACPVLIYFSLSVSSSFCSI